MKLTLGQAAKATGKSKTTISNAIKNGRMSGIRGYNNRYEIEPSELFRVYPPSIEPLDQKYFAQDPTIHGVILADMKAREREIELLREQLEHERAVQKETIADLRNERDSWKQQATALLSAPPKRNIWAGLFGRA